MRLAGAGIAVEFAGLHDEDDAADGGDVFKGVAFDGDEVGIEAWGEGADGLGHGERFGGYGGGTDDGVHGLIAGVTGAIDELLGITSVGTGDGIGAEDDFHVAGAAQDSGGG